ncbi:MAG: 1,4-alpha-glucan branching protein GlgB [Pseudohongiella sp.]|nr:1,4-alpha-glucan branching protein GlgB [Pseudohongiella sp.]MDO9519689.1 1,4-alpha-glucan branching protein GlgB [Pseudohongiella sp.]
MTAESANLLSTEDLYLFARGEHECAYKFLGAHQQQGTTRFAVWAPSASFVSVCGDFNGWNIHSHPLSPQGHSGIWAGVTGDATPGMHYKYYIVDANGHALPLKADPYAQESQLRPDTASMVPHESNYDWQDSAWLQKRSSEHPHKNPVIIYELHAGSWRRTEENFPYNYRELADQLIPYVRDMGFTHIQLMPVSEHPFDGSWGYQPIGLFCPTRRFGSPDDLRYLIDLAHQHDIGVLLDWVPAHFPADDHGLKQFDGTHLYEHADPRKGFHPDWNTLIFNYGRAEVISYLLSSAIFWLEEFHFDGLRVDAVASMLYLNYSRKEGEWIPNHFGGTENLEAISLLRLINERAYKRIAGIMMVAEESTAWPGVTQMTSQGGLGFGFKWNMGWMNDTLRYMSRDPIHRKHHHQDLRFGLVYAFSEQFILPLSHDEVVHGKRSLLEKMPGDDWQKFANLRAYLAFMWAHPGKKLLFMGAEFAQRREWNHDRGLDWHLLQGDQGELHQGIQKLVADLNHTVRSCPALYELDSDADGFRWIDADVDNHSVYIFMRKAPGHAPVIAVVNLTPVVHYHWRIGIPHAGRYGEILNTDSSYYGGSGVGNLGAVEAQPIPSHGFDHSIVLNLPPLGTLFLCHQV